MTNPFEDEKGVYHVLINEEGQHSLWPAFKEVPLGWTIALKSDTRAACLEFINQNWKNMRPKSLVERMEKQTEGIKPNLLLDRRLLLEKHRAPNPIGEEK